MVEEEDVVGKSNHVPEEAVEIGVVGPPLTHPRRGILVASPVGTRVQPERISRKYTAHRGAHLITQLIKNV